METFRRPLKCELSPSETTERRDRLALLYDEWRHAEEERKAAAKRLKEESDLMAKEMDRVSKEVRQGWTLRDVECREIRDDVRRRIDVMRMDTGEVVDSRPMHEHEFQRPLFALEHA
jgi:hypothetical protein